MGSAPAFREGREGFDILAKQGNKNMGRHGEQRFKANQFEYKSIHPN